MKPNPPIRGHTLIAEGRVWQCLNRTTEMYDGRWLGGCECGAKPPGFPHISISSIKRWHRQHKADLRGEITERGT